MLRFAPRIFGLSLLPCLLVFPLLLTLFCTCGRAQKDTKTVVGSIRYEATTQLLTADFSISPKSAFAPTLFGSSMQAFPQGGPNQYRGRRTLPFSNPIQINLPCGATNSTGCPLDISFLPPVADNIPDSIHLGSDLRFQALASGLQESENLIAFFEPVDRSKPQRILLQGPTASGRMSIPKEALAGFAPGEYEIYLIKQQLYQDSVPDQLTSIQTEFFTRSVPVILY